MFFNELKMKKIILLFALFLVCICNSQEEDKRFNIPKHSWVLGGEFSYSNQKETEGAFSRETKSARYLTSPSVGYAIADNLVIGVAISYLYAKRPLSEGISGFNIEDRFVGIEPYLIKYFNITNKLLFDIECFLGYSIGKIEGVDFAYKADSTLFSIGLRPGITYSVYEKLALKLSLGNIGYSKFKIEGTSDAFDIDETQDNFGLNFNTSNLSVGIIYLFK